MADHFEVIRIPHLFNKISAHLSRADLSQCSLVNWYWNSLFGPLVWHTLTFSEDSHLDQQPFHKKHRTALNWKCLNIRQLHSHDCRSLLFFNGPDSRCRHLRELDFTACLTHESTTQAVQLINTNPLLERLTIQGDFTLTQNNEAPQNLFSALLQHPALTHLRLSGIDTLDYEYGRALFTHLPPALKSLSLKCTSIANLDPDQVDPSDPSWPTEYLRLQQLSINSKWKDRTHECILFPLLRRCPKLKDLSISHVSEWTSGTTPPRPSFDLATLLRDHCPKVERLTVHNCQESESLAEILAGIEFFQISTTSPLHGQMSRVIATRWSSTLRELTFAKATSVQSADIQLILTSCPLLTKLLVWPDRILYDSNGVIQQDCSGLRLSEMTRSRWVCLGLEQLGLRILDDRPVHEGTSTDEQNQSTVTMRQALAQIGDLVHLQQLGFEWLLATKVDSKMAPLSRDFVQMDMSLSCGLNLLNGLKQLRKLLISVRDVEMDQKEMEWILESWPKLTVVSGLYRSSSRPKSAASAGVEEPAHIRWLREHRQSLSVL
ncbi:hypothetical protein BGX33_004545 [Mortierella sp. NVP41]|nr:hypothetical protein BGX33_004545 [Mortierella sp. NVP41]